MSRPHATMHSDAQAGERRTFGRHSRAVARRARGTSHSGMVGTATGTSTGAAVRMRDIPQIGSTRFARLRRTVPTGGRRSKRSPRLKRGGVLPSAQKTTAANFVRCLRDRGKSVKGGLPPPFHIPERGESRAPQARKGVSIPEPGAAGRRILRPQPLLLRGLRAALAALRKPELRTEGRRILRPQPLLLRGLRAALAALRKAGAKRRAVPGRGPNSKQDYDRKLFQIKAPSGNRSS